jgi:dTDP-4-dehydrorhamnose reductase
MVTRFIGHYETGVYDVRGGTPRPTLMVPVLQDLAAGRKPDVPAIAGPGWWRRPSRLIRAVPGSEPSYEVEPRADGPAPLLIVGDADDLTRLAVRACEARGLYYARAADDLDETLELAQPWAVFDARDHGGICGGAARSSRRESCCPVVARACAGRQVPSARITAAPSWAPLESLPGLLEIRTGEVYVPWDRSARPVQMLDALEAGTRVRADAGKEWTHVYGPEIVDLVLDLLIDGMSGVVSVIGERMSELTFARSLAMVADCDSELVVPVGSPAPKPLFGWSNPMSWLPPCESTLERFVREARAARKLGQLAVGDHADEPHLGPVEEPESAQSDRDPGAFALQNAAE